MECARNIFRYPCGVGNDFGPLGERAENGCQIKLLERLAVGKIATKLQLPVASAFRNQDYFDNRHPCYAGHAGIGIDGKLLARIKGADLLIAIGARLDEMTTNGYTLLNSPEPTQQLVHVFPSGDDMGRVFRPTLAINSSSEAFLDALDALKISAADANQRKTAHGDYEATRKPLPTPGAVKLEEVVLIVNEMLPDDAILTNGAGNYSAFFHRYFEYKHFRTQLGPTCGAMGFGLPAAIGAAIAEPHRTIVALAGDGCFLMNGQELATAKQYGLKLVVLVINNGIYGTIRMHQEKHFPGRPSGTSLTNPDFAALARSFGAHGETVTATKDFRQAFTRALAHDGVALIELQTDPEAITPKQTLTEIRSQPAAAPEKPHGQKR